MAEISEATVNSNKGQFDYVKRTLPDFAAYKSSIESLKENAEILKVCWQTNKGEERYKILDSLIENLEQVMTDDFMNKFDYLRENDISIAKNEFRYLK